MNQPARISYVIILGLMVLVVYQHLGTLVLTTLFGYLALQAFSIRGRKWLSVTFYVVAVIVIGAGLVYFSNLSYRTLPRIAEVSIPAMADFAEKNGIELPFTDYASLKTAAFDTAKEGITIVGQYAKVASFQFVLLIVGLVVPVSIFLGSGWTSNRGAPAAADNFYNAVTRELTTRFKTLYASFAKMMGAQIVIAAINAGLTAAFLILNNYPHAGLLITLVFLCGLIPIIGNIISNAVVVGVGFTFSSRTGVYALVFLVVIHKLEYFLNSKIVGERINSPMWLTLIGLLVGERLMGIPGMILAPVVLHCINVEASAYRSLPGGGWSTEKASESPTESPRKGPTRLHVRPD